MVPHLEFDSVRTEQAVSSFALATDLADHLVTHGVPFREAHATVGGLVAGCLSAGKDLSDLTSDELRATSVHFKELPELTPAASVRRKRTVGSTHPDEVEKQLQAVSKELDERWAWLGQG
jgi:argininosuccinate lyase